MAGGPEQKLDELVGVLDASILEFEDLLGELSDQSEKLSPRLDALSRAQEDTRSELAEIREMVELLTERIDRLTTISSELLRAKLPRPEN